MTIYTLGPEGTFSHEAALKHDSRARILFAKTIRDVFEEVEKNGDALGIVPTENSVGGTIGQTLDCLMEFDTGIIGELILDVRHNLVGPGGMNDIKTLYLHPQTYEQCEIFIRKNLPKAEVINTSSNGKSAEIISESRDKAKAAIIPKIAVGIYHLKVLKENVQDSRFNITRFLIIGKGETKKTRRDKTSIALKPDYDKPGLLFSVLGEFARKGINLTKIESRPSKGKLGEYIFFIDLEGHKTDANVAEALKNLVQFGSVKILGSYERKY